MEETVLTDLRGQIVEIRCCTSAVDGSDGYVPATNRRFANIYCFVSKCVKAVKALGQARCSYKKCRAFMGCVYRKPLLKLYSVAEQREICNVLQERDLKRRKDSHAIGQYDNCSGLRI